MRYIRYGGETFEFDIFSSLREGVCQNCKKIKFLLEVPSQRKKWCKDCFLQFFEKRIKKTVEKYKMFIENQKIGICLSGGKDSSSLLWSLKKIFPDLNLLGIHLNLGIGFYSITAENAVKKLCESLKVPLYIYNLKEKEGFSIDEFVFTHYKRKICAVCGNIKRYLFSKIAKELNLEALATGHHLDDLVSTMLSLLFQGDFPSLMRLYPVLPPLFERQARKIKPLCTTPEVEIFYYSYLNELPLETRFCPHREVTPSKRMKNIIKYLEKENPQIKYQLFSVFNKKLIPLVCLQRKEELINKCKQCGELTDSIEQICGRCKKIALLGKISERTIEISSEQFLEKTSKLNSTEYIVFNVSKESLLKDSLFGNRQIPSEYLEKSDRNIRKFFRQYKGKIIFFKSEQDNLGYCFAIRLRKMGFEAFSIKPKGGDDFGKNL